MTAKIRICILFMSKKLPILGLFGDVQLNLELMAGYYGMQETVDGLLPKYPKTNDYG